MKCIFTFAVILLISFKSFAQVPEKFSYQAVIRNNDSSLLTNSDISVKIIIRQGSVSGLNVYEETHRTTTNSNGLCTLQIGTGSETSGEFSEIDWSTGSYFTETQLDLTGGSNFEIIGVSQLLSVPYALHAKTYDRAEIINVNTSRNFLSTDINNTIECTNSTTLTLVNDFSEMRIGDTINLEAHNGADLRIQASSGVSLNYTNGGRATFESETGVVRFGLLRKSGDNSYIISGQ